MSGPQPSPVFTTYWKFMEARQQLFWSRARGSRTPWTNDPILQRFRFTNVYRACDRISQYLIKHVQYRPGDPRTPEDILFRTVLFKLFNRIETWELLHNELGDVSITSFSFDRYQEVLTRSKNKGERIYSAAYIMPSATKFGEEFKHQNHLRLLDYMFRDGFASKVAKAATLKQLYELLLTYPSLGPFLAFQLAIDINYSEVVEFDENDFVVAGPGAISGIRKCFVSRDSWSDSDIIRWMVEEQSEQLLTEVDGFEPIGRRLPKLIDLQNVFCEVDKYSRVAHPEIVSSRSRIKQVFRANSRPLVELWFPPKWGINDLVSNQLRNGKELTDAAK